MSLFIKGIVGHGKVIPGLHHLGENVWRTGQLVWQALFHG
jgi:hypothetical protein